jgi:hypothetical protein
LSQKQTLIQFTINFFFPRKLTAQVTAEISQHYHLVHKIHIIHDDYKESNGHGLSPQPGIAKSKKRISRGPSPTLTSIPQLPQHPVPLSPLMQQQQSQQQLQQQQMQQFQQLPIHPSEQVKLLIEKELAHQIPVKQELIAVEDYWDQVQK